MLPRNLHLFKVQGTIISQGRDCLFRFYFTWSDFIVYNDSCSVRFIDWVPAYISFRCCDGCAFLIISYYFSKRVMRCFDLPISIGFSNKDDVYFVMFVIY